MGVATARINAVRCRYVQRRDRDHHQDIFRLNYELLPRRGKDVNGSRTTTTSMDSSRETVMRKGPTRRIPFSFRS